MRVACIRLEQPSSPIKEQISTLAEACLRFTPQVALSEAAVFLEISRCTKLYSESQLLGRIRVLLKRMECEGKIAIANDIPTALAMTIWPRTRRELPLEALQIYASPFGGQDKFSMIAKQIHILYSLGLKNIGELLELPRAALGIRFAKEVIWAIDRIGTAEILPWPSFKPKEKILETTFLDPDQNIQSLEPLLFILRGLADRVLLRLRGRGELALSIKINIQIENYSQVKKPVRDILLELAMPQSSAIALVPILAQRLERVFEREPLESPANMVSLEVIRTSPSFGRQRDMFSKREEELEAFRSVVARISEKLGENRAFLASTKESYLPEKSWEKTLEEPKEIEAKVAIRPLRLLREPQKAQRLENFLVCRRRRWHIESMQGPERISGEWWLGEASRDYFRVQTREGEELWIFSASGEHNFYLHGIFD